MTADERFQVTQARWAALFEPPLEGRAELWDYDDKVALAVFNDGVKLWEERNTPEERLNQGLLEAFASAFERSNRYQEEEASMRREEVSKEQLVDLINAELARHPECQDLRVSHAPQKLREPGDDGANWDYRDLIGTDRPLSGAGAATAARVFAEMAARYNLA